MPMSTTYISQIVVVLALVLPKIGIPLGNDDITALVQAVLVLGGIVWTLYQRTTLQKAPDGIGDVTATGIRKG